MLFSDKRGSVLSSPTVGLLDLTEENSRELVEDDFRFLSAQFRRVERLEPTAPRCDVLFLYAQLASDGTVIGADRGLREIIRDSGAKVVVVASPNPSGHYIKAGKQKPYGQANLVMTLDRRGDAFAHFFSALFLKMQQGVPMPSAWVSLNPQTPVREQPIYPETIFACEIGPLTFS